MKSVAPPRVSVVMPTRNAATYLLEAIASLLNQTFSAFELIVVDGASTDMTLSIVEGVTARDPRVRLVRQRHTGIVDARNRGAELARGEYLAWLDADDVALPYRFERQVRFLDAHLRIAAVGGTIVVTDEHLRPIVGVPYPTESGKIAAALPDANVLAASAAMIRLSAYRAVGGCRGPFRQGAEDYDLWLRLSEHYELANLPDLLAYYRTHTSQVSSTGVERFVIPTVAAQLSARARRAKRADPYGHVDVFTYDQFTQTEPTRSGVDRAILNVTAGQATYLALIGQPAAARKLLAWGTDITSASSIGRQTRARLRLAQAVVAWTSNQILRALLAGAKAALLDPRRAAIMFGKGARARFWRQRGNTSSAGGGEAFARSFDMKRWLDFRALIRQLGDYRAEWKWRLSGCSGPLPANAKRRLLGQYADDFGLHILIETGSYLGDTVAALQRKFDHVYSIELSPGLAWNAMQRFQRAPNVTIIQGDSGSVLPKLIGDLRSPALFWLDGHFSGGVTARGSLDTPVLAELDAVLSHPAPGHVVLIDDAAWLDLELGGNGLEQIRDRIVVAQPSWTVELRDDIVRAHASAASCSA